MASWRCMHGVLALDERVVLMIEIRRSSQKGIMKDIQSSQHVLIRGFVDRTSFAHAI